MLTAGNSQGSQNRRRQTTSGVLPPEYRDNSWVTIVALHHRQPTSFSRQLDVRLAASDSRKTLHRLHILSGRNRLALFHVFRKDNPQMRTGRTRKLRNPGQATMRAPFTLLARGLPRTSLANPLVLDLPEALSGQPTPCAERGRCRAAGRHSEGFPPSTTATIRGGRDAPRPSNHQGHPPMRRKVGLRCQEF